MAVNRVPAIIISVMLVSTALAAASFLIAGNKSIEGDWHLTYVRSCDENGEMKETIPENYKTMTITSVHDNIVNGTFYGTSFTAAYHEELLRFRVDTGNEVIQAVGCFKTKNALILSIASHSATGNAAYSLLFTKDGVVPSLIEYVSMNIEGGWIMEKRPFTGQTVKSMSVKQQNVSVLHGTIEYDNMSTKFRASLSMVFNANMHLGVLVDDNGNFWMMSVKKGLLVLYAFESDAGEIENKSVYLVRNPGGIVFPTSPALGNGKIWEGRTGYGSEGSLIEIEDHSLVIMEQNDCMIAGKMISGGNEIYFKGMFISSYPVAAEIYMWVDGDEIQSTMFINGNTIHVVIFNGKTFNGMLSMEFGSKR